MKNSSGRLAALIALGAFLFLTATAFAAPKAPDWLAALAKTTPTVSTADAEAVMMLDENVVEIESDGRRTTRTRQAFKILTRDGKKFAHAVVNYQTGASQVKSLKAWVIKPTGEVLALGKEETRDIALYASALELYSESRAQTLSATAHVAPGAWFAYEAVTVERSILYQTVWHFQGPIPVQRSALTVKFPAGWSVTDRPLNGAAPTVTETPKLRTWQMTEIPAAPNEAMSPSAASFAPGLALDFVPPPNSPAAREAIKTASWQELSRQFTPRYDAAAVPDDALRQHVVQLLADVTEPWERLQRICHFVQAVNYISIQLDSAKAGGLFPRPAARVFQCNYGDCKDKATLLRAMLALAGFKTHPLIVLASARDRIESDWPAPTQFNHVIVAIEVAPALESDAIIDHPSLGRLLLFDPTDENTPLGLVANSRMAREGLLLAGDSGGLIDLPPARIESEQFKRTVRADIDAAGNVSAQLDEDFTGLAAATARGELREQKKADYHRQIERWLGATLPALRGTKVDATDGFPAAKFTLRVEFASIGYGKLMRDQLLIFKPVLVSRREATRLPKKERKLPVALRANAFEERAEFTLPAGYAVDELPRAVRLESNFGRYALAAREEGGKILFERSLVLQSVEVPTTEYEAVRGFFEKVHQSEQSPVVLRRLAGPPPAMLESDFKKAGLQSR